jgi:hypothetical protein
MNTIKANERLFFTLCLKAFIFKKETQWYKMTVRDLIQIIQPIIHYKQCWYYLDKWSSKDFYDYGITLDLGWFYPDKLTGEYKKIYDELNNK